MSAATLTRPRAATRGPGAPRVWASYARLSLAKNDGRGASLAIGRQLRENRAYIERVDPGARIVEFPNDDGYSGFLGVWRPDFEKMMSGVAAGEFHAMIGWHADRLTRQVGVTARIVDACETSGTELHTALGGWHSDPTRLYIESVVAEGESRQKRNRMLSKHKELAQAGGFSGGRRRYGYTDSMAAVVPHEAEIIRDLADRALRGESLRAMARSLNEAGVPTALNVHPEGSKRAGQKISWAGQSIKAMLVSEHLAGYRTWEGTRYPAEWAPILDMATHEALVLKLTDPARQSHDAGTSNKYLLSGLATCAKCGGRVYCTKHRGGRIYTCTSCNRMRNGRADAVEAWVRMHVVKRLEAMDANGVLASDEDNQRMAGLVAERDEIPKTRALYAGMAARGEIDPATLAAMTRALGDREKELEAAVTVLAESHAAPVRALDGATGPDAGRVWDEWTEDATGAGFARQRAIISLMVDIVIGSGSKGRAPFDPESVRVSFRPID